jgi:peptide/nickel transport system substrate-binding protein
MEQAVIDGKAAFSRTDSQSKSVNWLSLIIPKDASLVREYLEDFAESGKIPVALKRFENSPQYYQDRYEAAIKWITEKNHAIISNGPFYLEGYSPEARIITIKSFDDEGYPFGTGMWKKFEAVQFPEITQINVPERLVQGARAEIQIRTADASQLYYFINDASGVQVDGGIIPVIGDSATLALGEETTNKMQLGATDLKIYAISDSVLRPDIYATSFLVVASDDTILKEIIVDNDSKEQGADYLGTVSIVVGATIMGVILYLRKARRAQMHKAR